MAAEGENEGEGLNGYGEGEGEREDNNPNTRVQLIYKECDIRPRWLFGLIVGPSFSKEGFIMCLLLKIDFRRRTPYNVCLRK